MKRRRVRARLAVAMIGTMAGTAVAQTTTPASPVARVTAGFALTDVAQRRAALQQIALGRDVYAGAVVGLLERPDVATRSAAMEMLERWAAPVAGIDPWDAASITPARLAELRAWAAGPATRANTRPATLPAAIVEQELDVLLAAPNAAATHVVRERLAVAGEWALPAVLARLGRSPTDEGRRRLTAVRYRLVLSDARVLAGVECVDRLASDDVETRRTAVRELAETAMPEDARLLSELFSDADSLVREIALGALKKLSGESATQALVILLDDPSPNVRATVLKALSDDESPPESLVGPLAAYLKSEQDVDLLSPALRLLGRMKALPATVALIGAVSHKEWRVRAEAADALAAKLTAEVEIVPEESRKPIRRALLARLDDAEPFVVSRALLALLGDRETVDLAAMAKAIDARPELLPDVVAALSHRSNTPDMTPWLRKWTKDVRPTVRAKAYAALIGYSPTAESEDLKASLADADADVRAVGVVGLASALNQLRPQSDTIRRPGFFGFGARDEKIDMAEWAADFRSGKKNRPKWMNDFAPRLDAVLTGLPASARGATAVVLAAFGQTERAVALTKEVSAGPDGEVPVNVLFWLPPAEQTALLPKLLAAARDDRRQMIMYELNRQNLPGLKAALWQSLAEPGVSDSEVVAARDGLQRAYFQTAGRPEPADRKAIRATIEDQLAHGNAVQIAIALTMLKELDAPAAAVAATKVAADPKTGRDLKRDATHVRLLALPPGPANEAAVAAFADADVRDLSVRYLAAGRAGLNDDAVKTHLAGMDAFDIVTTDTPDPLTAPAGLDVNILRELSRDADVDLAAYAGYLLVMYGHADGVPPLRAAWEKRSNAFSPFHRLMYRAIAKRNDDALTPLLAKVYAALGEVKYQIPELYETTKTLTGLKAIELRARIKREMGGRLSAGEPGS